MQRAVTAAQIQGTYTAVLRKPLSSRSICRPRPSLHSARCVGARMAARPKASAGGILGDLSRAITSKLGGGGGDVAGATSTSTSVFSDNAPSWPVLTEMVAAQKLELKVPHKDLEAGPTNAQALRRTFGQPGEPRVKFYRDHAAWCPYCQKIWLQLEEKRIPYTVEKINMNCYGDKKRAYLAMCPAGLLPAAEIDGKLYTESAVIAEVLERDFPDHVSLIPAPGSAQHFEAESLLRLERGVFSRWMGWLTSPRGDAAGKAGFVEAVDAVDDALAKNGGPFFLGESLTLVDITFTPFLERMAASVAYYKGLRMVGGGTWPHLEAWFEAMSERDTYNGTKSDFYTHCHDLPPQLGGCAFNEQGPAVAAAIDGTDGEAWHLPLAPLSPTALEPWFAPETPDLDRLEAASAIVSNHKAVTRFAARGAGTPGARPVRAPLADPTATPNEDAVPAVDAALRHVVHALLVGVDAAQLGEDALQVVGSGGSGMPGGPVVVSAAYLRDRVGVPRDMSYPAARQLRAHLNWIIDSLK